MMNKYTFLLLLIPLFFVGSCGIKKQSLETYQAVKTVQTSQLNITDSLYSKLYDISYDLTIDEETRDSLGRITSTKKTKLNVKDKSKESNQVLKLNVADSLAKDSANFEKQIHTNVATKPVLSSILPSWLWLIFGLVIIVGFAFYSKIKKG